MLGNPEQEQQFGNKLREGYCWLRDYITAIKHGRLHPFTLVERKARAATRNEPWGPTGAMLNELAEISEDYQDCQIIFAVLEFRLQQDAHKWRNVYKALQVLEFLLKRGSQQCCTLAQDLLPLLGKLQSFHYIGPEGQDHGINVRIRSQAVHALIQDPRGLAEARQQLAARFQSSAARPSAALSSGKGPTVGAGSANGPATSTNASQFAVTRGAGESKGVTLEENKRQLAALKQLLALPQNRRCADCQGSEAAARPSWASINIGVFICMRCAGIHRGLGVHISKVRSCTLDTWLPEQVQLMAALGNEAANAYWEARLPSGLRPARDSVDLERFIRLKYASHEWADLHKTWPPPVNAAEAADHGTQQGQQQQQQQPAHVAAGAEAPVIRLPEQAVATGGAGGPRQVCDTTDLLQLDSSEDSWSNLVGRAASKQEPPSGPAPQGSAATAQQPAPVDPTLDIMTWLDLQYRQGSTGATASWLAPATVSAPAWTSHTAGPSTAVPTPSAQVITTQEFRLDEDAAGSSAVQVQVSAHSAHSMAQPALSHAATHHHLEHSAPTSWQGVSHHQTGVLANQATSISSPSNLVLVPASRPPAPAPAPAPATTLMQIGAASAPHPSTSAAVGYSFSQSGQVYPSAPNVLSPINLVDLLGAAGPVAPAIAAGACSADAQASAVQLNANLAATTLPLTSSSNAIQQPSASAVGRLCTAEQASSNATNQGHQMQALQQQGTVMMTATSVAPTDPAGTGMGQLYSGSQQQRAGAEAKGQDLESLMLLQLDGFSSKDCHLASGKPVSSRQARLAAAGLPVMGLSGYKRL